ncbi:MAG: hypothetical protein Q9169_000434 [Polycauliona sp. 2 TL-2023]
MIHFSGLQHPQSGSNPQAEPLEPTQRTVDVKSQPNTDTEETIRSWEQMLIIDMKQVSLRKLNLEEKGRLNKIIHGHTELSHGGYPEAIESLEKLSRTLSISLTILRKKVRIRLAKLYLDETGIFAGAETIYQNALWDPIMEEEVLIPIFAHCLERLARPQIKQDKYEEARRSYPRLLDLPEIRRQAILVNLGFIERKLGRIEEAKRLFEQASISTKTHPNERG